MEFIKQSWNMLVNLFEYGDLVPLMVLISGVHYASVLRGKDGFIVAVAVGLLVDLGHFRTVRAAVRYGWKITGQLFVRWGMVFVMTSISLAYHQRYYDDWWLSIPLPLLIAFLAWQQHTDRNISKPSASDTQSVRKPAQEVDARPAKSKPVAQPTRKDGVALAPDMSTADKVMAIYASNPHATQAQVGKQLAISRQAVGEHLRKLEDDGKINRNGKVEVIA